MEKQKVRLGEILDNYDSLRKPLSSMQRENFKGEYPYYGAQGIIDNVADFRCDGEYLLIAEDGENLSSRKAPIAQIAKGKFWVNNHAHIVKNNERSDIRYVCYLLNSSDIAGYVTGAAQPKLSQGNLNKIVVEIPNITIQHRIASILSTYDTLIENNTKRIRLLEKMAENLYKEWFSYNRIKNDAKVVRLTDIITITRGLSYSSEEIECNEGVDLINLKNIQSYGGFRYDGTKKFAGKYKDEQIVCNGDLVMGVTDMTQDRRTVGSVALIPDTGKLSVISADLIKITSEISSVFLFGMFKYGSVSKYVAQFANGANVLHLRPKVLHNVKVLLPSLELVKEYVEKVSPIISEQNKLYVLSTQLARQRDLLLPRLMSGKLEVKEELLE